MNTTARPRVLLSTGIGIRTTGLMREDALTGRNYSQAVAAAGGLPTMVAVLEPELAGEDPAGHDALAASIARFTVFDGAGLLVMGAAFVLLGGRTPARSA